MVPTQWGPAGPLTLPPAAGEAVAGMVYTCPMHPDVRQNHPGVCPRCGMRLQPVATSAGTPMTPQSAHTPMRPATLSSGGAYTCPMHPQVVQDHPGKCPICRMDLVRKGGAMSGMGGMR